MIKMFRKTLSVALAAGLLLSPCAFADETIVSRENTASLADVSLKAVMKASETGEDYIVAETKHGRKIRLNISDSTYIIDGTSGAAASLSAIKPGDDFYAEYSSIMTKSIPPQSNAQLICIGSASGINLVYADEVVKSGDSVFVTDTANDLVLNITAETRLMPYKTKNIVGIDDIKKGCTIIAWYDAVTLSLPAQATATKAVIIPPASYPAVPISRLGFAEHAFDTLSSFMTLPKNAPVKFLDTESLKIAALQAADIIKGKSESLFAPGDSVTREEAAAIICRMAKYAGAELPQVKINPEDPAFAGVSEWALPYVSSVMKAGIMIGTDIDFEPKAKITEEQTALVMERIADMVKTNDESFADKLSSLMPQDKNYMFSPLSLKTALAMAANGSEGETRDEILSALGIENLDEYNKSVKEMIENYSKSDILNINVANSIWLNTDKTAENFSDDFEKLMKENFKADSGTVTDKSISLINDWVKEKTNGKIPSIVSDKNSDFLAMLVNAVYFKGAWQNDFSKSATEDGVFTDRNGKENTVSFMHDTAWRQVSQKDGVTITKLPYKTSDGKNSSNLDVSMYLLMSDKAFNAEKELSAAKFDSVYTALSMPKFRIEYSAGMSDMLKKIGINKAFTNTADLSSMLTGSGRTLISDVIHKTYIDVDEEGTEAAAVTGVSVGATSLPPTPTEINYNKPFTFVIKDNTSGDILFMGEYAFAE